MSILDVDARPVQLSDRVRDAGNCAVQMFAHGRMLRSDGALEACAAGDDVRRRARLEQANRHDAWVGGIDLARHHRLKRRHEQATHDDSVQGPHVVAPRGPNVP